MLDRYGVGAEDRFVDVPSIAGRAHVLVAGQGPPVVLVNGIGLPAAMFAPLMGQLDGVTLYAVDMPGYGLTSSGESVASDLRAGAVRFLEDVLDGLGLEHPVFVTNSLGSTWTLWLALDRPERVAAHVLVGWPAIVLDTSAPLPMRLLSVRGLGRFMTTAQPPSPRQVRQLSKMVHEDPLPPEIAEVLLETERLPGFRQTFLAMLHALLRLRGGRPALALTATQLADVRQPTRLIVGADDPMCASGDARRFASALPDADAHVVDGGHAPWLHHAERVGALVSSFLQDHRDHRE